MQVDVIQSSKGLNKIKKQRKGKFDLCLSWDTHLLLPSDKGTLGSREAWRLSVLDWIILLFFLDFQFADGRSWDFLVSIVTCINSYNKFPLLSIFPIGILSGECRLIHHAPSCHIIQGNWKPMQQLCRIVWPLMTDSSPEFKEFLTLNSAMFPFLIISHIQTSTWRSSIFLTEGCCKN